MPGDNDIVPYNQHNPQEYEQREETTHYYYIRQVVTIRPQDQYGALVVYSTVRGLEISLYSDKKAEKRNVYHANAVGRRVNDEEIIAAVFPRVEPGNYKVIGAGFQSTTHVTIFAGEIAEIDDR